MCWHSVAHSDHCQVWSTHPSLKNKDTLGTFELTPWFSGWQKKSFNTMVGKEEFNFHSCNILWITEQICSQKSSNKMTIPITSDLWRNWQQSPPYWRSRLKQISSTTGWSWFWCHRVCRSHRIDPAVGCFHCFHHGPPGSHKHNCHVSQSDQCVRIWGYRSEKLQNQL